MDDDVLKGDDNMLKGNDDNVFKGDDDGFKVMRLGSEQARPYKKRVITAILYLNDERCAECCVKLCVCACV